MRLNELQTEFLEAFFQHQTGFFLTGGAALVGFYFGHRDTQDLDLFTLGDEMERGFAAAKDAAACIGATVEPIQTSPDFRRFLVRRPGDSIVVDLVREYVFQLDPEKVVIQGIRIDPPEEIFANKLCALLSRSEVRDLVDVRQLEMSGLSFTDALSAAEQKDTGLTPAQLAWVLGQINIGDETMLPGGVTPGLMREYLRDLIIRLQKLALPT